MDGWICGSSGWGGLAAVGGAGGVPSRPACQQRHSKTAPPSNSTHPAAGTASFVAKAASASVLWPGRHTRSGAGSGGSSSSDAALLPLAPVSGAARPSPCRPLLPTRPLRVWPFSRAGSRGWRLVYVCGLFVSGVELQHRPSKHPQPGEMAALLVTRQDSALQARLSSSCSLCTNHGLGLSFCFWSLFPRVALRLVPGCACACVRDSQPSAVLQSFVFFATQGWARFDVTPTDDRHDRHDRQT